MITTLPTESTEFLKELTKTLAARFPDEALEGMQSRYKKRWTPMDIVREVAFIYSCNPEDITKLNSGHENKNRRGPGDFLAARATAAFLLTNKRLGNMTLKAAGGILGGRDHSTVLYTIGKLVRDEYFSYAVSAVSKMIGVEYVE